MEPQGVAGRKAEMEQNQNESNRIVQQFLLPLQRAWEYWITDHALKTPEPQSGTPGQKAHHSVKKYL
ncbi:hypothetical protein NDU88_003387 [Pleurodeles waltl]|uniref:Uncharacterized protein n=1 Tax=Pleurodeles waltl TaxID=8319 RepID=A0AAV7WPA1_PLEWA|nr:hypothetical protein NDU88_003386 [Pleurodeles waltl]KAJ1215780.1 hypothetical protein NDU88_003387 [Pleurodeles waltl]